MLCEWKCVRVCVCTYVRRLRLCGCDSNFQLNYNNNLNKCEQFWEISCKMQEPGRRTCRKKRQQQRHQHQQLVALNGARFPPNTNLPRPPKMFPQFPCSPPPSTEHNENVKHTFDQHMERPAQHEFNSSPENAPPSNCVVVSWWKLVENHDDGGNAGWCGVVVCGGL